MGLLMVAKMTDFCKTSAFHFHLFFISLPKAQKEGKKKSFTGRVHLLTFCHLHL